MWSKSIKQKNADDVDDAAEAVWPTRSKEHKKLHPKSVAPKLHAMCSQIYLDYYFLLSSFLKMTVYDRRRKRKNRNERVWSYELIYSYMCGSDGQESTAIVRTRWKALCGNNVACTTAIGCTKKNELWWMKWQIGKEDKTNPLVVFTKLNMKWWNWTAVEKAYWFSANACQEDTLLWVTKYNCNAKEHKEEDPEEWM